MTTQRSGQASVWSTKTLVAGLFVVAMVFASMMAAASARASTTFVVNGTGDAPDASTTASACDTDLSTTGKQCTLRAAIEQANATPGADTINFAIPGTGVKTIHVGETGLVRLPDITERVTIDGYTQAGRTPTPRRSETTPP
jgi:CSLREA domain-containing protein